MSIEPGRLALSAGASVTTISGRCDQIELQLPRAARVVSVDGDGLTDWSEPAPDRLRLRFDGPTPQRRGIRIEAWLPVATDPMAGNGTPARPEVDLPWPRWIDVETRPGQLTLLSPSRFQLLGAVGLTPQPVAPSPPAAGAVPGGVDRAVYRVDRSDKLGKLTWEPEPPRLGVLVQSQLTILPDVAEWAAVLRYDVSGGATDAIHLRLPTAWAAAARLQLVGRAHQLTAEVQGPYTFWKIRPESPIWGSQRVVIRSTTPLPEGGTLNFPDLSPLGRGGTVDTYLALVDASGRSVVTEGSPGLQPIADETRFRGEEFAVPHGLTPSVYHVRREGWSLALHWRGDRRSHPPGRDEAHTTLAELTGTLQGDGSLVGQALYEIEPRSGALLAIDPPARSEPLWAALNNNPVAVLRSAGGQWLIPLAGADETATPGQAQVRLIWKTAPDAPRADGTYPLALPQLSEPNVPTLVTIDAPPEVDVRNPSGRFEPIPRERLEVAHAEWLGRAIAESVGTLDRNSQRECEALVSSLVQFELWARDAERSARWNRTSPPAFSDLRIARLDERLKAARKTLTDALQRAGLDELSESARIHVGLVAAEPDAMIIEIPEGNPSVRLRCLGYPRIFQGEASGKEPGPLWTWSAPRGGAMLDRPLGYAFAVLVAVASSLAIFLLLRSAERTPWLGPIALSSALLAVALAAGPAALGTAMAMGWLGWASRTS